MTQVFLLSLAAAFNPTLLGATTVMLLLPNPKRLLLGYLLGAMLTSITLGLVIVFSLQGSGAESTAKHTVNPALDLTLGGIALLIAFVIGTGRHRRLSERRERKRAGKPQKTPRWQRALSKGSARDTFVVGALLTFPGASYLAGLDQIDKQDFGTAATVVTVLGFNLIMLLLLELPLLGYTIAPEWTPDAVARFKAWLNRNGGRIAVIGAAGIGVALIVRGVAALL